MIDYIVGEVAGIYEDSIVLDHDGIGYRVFTTSNSKDHLVEGEVTKMHIEMIVREDSLTLFGFSGMDEMIMFKHLISVTSIGPRSGLGILSCLSPEVIKYAIVENDVEKLTQAPGVGKKTAGRIILELKDKIKTYDLEDIEEETLVNDDFQFALEALVNLGYQRNEVQRFLQRKEIAGLPINQMIKEAMKGLEHKE